jgi:DUF4097 and DUF4098 domain-containing protein YvlB
MVANINGNVRIDSVNNTISIGHVNGNVNLDEIAANTSVNLVNALIVAKVTLPLNGTINMDNTNGGIDLEIPVNTSANFSANVTNGAITVSNLVLQNPISTATSLSGTLGAGQGTITLTVVNGNIDVSGF